MKFSGRGEAKDSEPAANLKTWNLTPGLYDIPKLGPSEWVSLGVVLGTLPRSIGPWEWVSLGVVLGARITPWDPPKKHWSLGVISLELSQGSLLGALPRSKLLNNIYTFFFFFFLAGWYCLLVCVLLIVYFAPKKSRVLKWSLFCLVVISLLTLRVECYT